MATMGVRVRQPMGGGINLNLGEDFAKAMFGDWEAELKMAKARSDLALDEWQAKQIKSAIEYNNARTATENWELGSRKGGVEAGANIIQGGNQPQPEAPAPVDLGLPDTTLAIPMPRPDLSPAPVEEAPEEYGPPIPPELSAAPVELPDEATAAPAPRPIIASGGDYELGGPDEPAAIEDVPELLPDQEDISVQPVPVTEAVTAEEVPQAEVPTGGERQPMPVSATGDVIQVDEGPTGDTAAVTTPAGNVRIMSREDALKLSAAVIANGGNVTGGLRELAGIAGIQSSPTLSPDVKAATLLSGNVPSRESILGTDEAIRKDLATRKPGENLVEGKPGQFFSVSYDDKGNPVLTPVQGSAVEAPAPFGDTEGGIRKNIIAAINLKLDNNQPITAEEAMTYKLAYDAEFGPKLVTERSPDGRMVQSVQQPQPPAGLRTPDQLTPGQAQPQVAQPPATPETVETQPPAVPAPGEPQVAPQVQQPKYKSYGGYTPEGQTPPSETTVEELPGFKVTTTTSGDVKTPKGSEFAEKTYQTQYEGARNASILDKFLPGDEPGVFQQMLQNMSEDDTITTPMIEAITDPKTREFARAAQGFINAFLRRDSGAAIGVKEFKRYYQRFIQPVHQTERDYIDTRMNRLTAMKGARYSLNGAIKPDQLMQLDQEYAKYGLDLDWAPPGELPRQPGDDDMPPPPVIEEGGLRKQGDTYILGD